MNDPIQEIHAHRDKLAAKFNHDVHAIFEDMRRRQTASGHPVVSLEVMAKARGNSKARRRLAA